MNPPPGTKELRKQMAALSRQYPDADTFDLMVLAANWQKEQDCARLCVFCGKGFPLAEGTATFLHVMGTTNHTGGRAYMVCNARILRQDTSPRAEDVPTT